MNQTTRRKARHLLHCLITLVVIGSQIALPLGALVAAVQPTPQMIQTTAQQAGLGDWFAQRASDLAAIAQPLWGEPTSAQAAVTYGNPVALLSTTHSATITTGRTGLCTILNCFITNSANVVDANTANFGNISIPLGLLGGVYFAVDTSVTFPAGYRAGFLIDNGGGLIDLSLFSSFSIKTYLGGTLQETASSAALLDVSLFGGANSNAISFVTTKAFDEVRLEAGSLIGALLDLDVYYAFVQQPVGSAPIWGIKNYTDFGHLNTAVSPWTWVTVTTLTGGNYNAAAAITRSQGIIFNQTTRVFYLVNPATGALTALMLTNSIPRTLSYNVATYDPATNRYFTALENDQYGHIFTVNTATNQITYVSEINAGQAINSDDWVFINGKVIGLDHGTVETWDVTNNSYSEQAAASGTASEVAGMWVNADGTLGAVSHTTDVTEYDITTNANTIVAQTNASFPCCGEPNDLAGSIFGLAANMPSGVLSQAYTGSVTAGGGTPPYSNYTATGLPAGLSINSATGVVSGTPTAVGTFSVNFSVTDSESYTAPATYDIAIIASAPGGVATNLAAWYKAGSTVSTTQWNDESGNGKHMLAAGDGTAARMPALEADPGAANNFNPRVAFLSNADGNRKWTMTASGNNVFANTTTPGTIFNISSFLDETVYDVPQMYAFEDDDPGLNLITDRNTANDIQVIFQRDNGGTGSAGWDFAIPGVSQTQPLLTAHAWNYAAGGNTFTFNGYDYTPSTNSFIGAMASRYIFGAETTGAGGEAHSGYTAENIVYSTNWPSNSNERKRINSYLAIKYGITLLGSGTLAGGAADATFGGTADYLDSASTVIWSGTTSNSGYHNNVAGIGRDDASALNQKQSTSTNLGFQPVIGLGTIAASNAANTNTFSADKSFVMWGSNNQTASYSASYTPTSFTPAAGYYRMNRVWKVQETGTVGNLVVQATGTDHLLVSSDPTFATGVTEIAMSSGSATVNFTNGQYFTFGKALTAPGGVSSGLGMWLKADQGTSTTTDGATVSAWDDASLANSDVAQTTAGLQPTYSSNGMNFNPGLSFSTDALYKDDGTSAIPNQSDPVTIISVSTNRTTGGGFKQVVSFSGGADYPSMHWSDQQVDMYIDGTTNVWNRHTTLVSINTPTIANGRTNNADPKDVRVSFNGRANEQTFTGADGTFPAASGSADLVIGAETPGGGEAMDGLLTEAIVYNRFLADAELMQVNSYLAIKYGITLIQSTPTNYVDASGEVIWNATTNNSYSNNIAGIGRDDASTLQQKQAKSVNSGFQVTVGLGAIAATNAANTRVFSVNKSFLLWGDNGQAASYGVSYTPGSFTPTGGYYRMNRIWKVQETGTITNVVVLADGAEHLLVSSDPTFATGVTEINMSSGSVTVDFTNGQYFTFGATATAPGGVAGNLAAWYKANAGAESSSAAATDGASVDAWRDQSLNSNDAAQSTGTLKPEWLADNGKFNFNPSVTFVPDARMQAQLAAGPWNNNDGTAYIIYNQETVKTGWRNLVDFGLTASDSNNPQLGMSDNNRIATWMDGFDRDNTNWTPVINETRLIGYDWQFNVGGHSYYFDGEAFTGSTTHKIGTTGINIGNFANIGGDPQLGEYFPGQIAEIVLFGEQHDASKRARVQSYLALKYGITLDANPGNSATNFDYVHSGSTVIWAGNSTNSGYHNDVTGIGRDDASALDQRKSKSINGDDPIIIDNGAAFSANRAFLVWGNNNGAVSLTANYNGGSNNRLARVWKVQETGTVGVIKVVLPRSAVPNVGLRSLIVHSSDGAFGTVDRTILLTSQGGNYVATVDFNSGDIFTFSSSSSLPEINVTPATIDFGTVNSGSTSPAQAVTIQNQGDVSLSLSSIALSGADAARFAISSNNCGAALNAGASCTVQLTFTPTAAGNRSAQLVITSNDSDESTVNVALSGATLSSSGVGGSPGTYNLAVTKSASVSNATIGTPFTYTITVLNKGTIAAANVVMTDPLPAGVTFGSANATGGGNCTHNSGTVTCTWPSLAGGASATVTISVTP